jgi:hypothetical protein
MRTGKASSVAFYPSAAALSQQIADPAADATAYLSGLDAVRAWAYEATELRGGNRS